MLLSAQFFQFEPTPAALAVVSVWLFVIGGSVGSFLNVVIYRMPAGKSIIHPGSRCPNCSHAIRWYHNLPIVGWLILRGRCYDCGERISPRYPIVELIVAALFVGMAWIDVLPYWGQPQVQLPSPYDLPVAVRWAQLAYHLTLLCGLLCASWIEFDWQRLPWKLWALVLVVGVALPLWQDQIRPVHYLPLVRQPLNWNPSPLFIGWTDGLLGATCAALLGWPATMFAWLPLAARRTAVLALLWVGLFLGWQGVAVLACLTAAAYLGVSVVCVGGSVAGRIPWTGLLFALVVVWFIAWQPLLKWLPVLG